MAWIAVCTGLRKVPRSRSRLSTQPFRLSTTSTPLPAGVTPLNWAGSLTTSPGWKHLVGSFFFVHLAGTTGGWPSLVSLRPALLRWLTIRSFQDSLPGKEISLVRASISIDTSAVPVLGSLSSCPSYRPRPTGSPGKDVLAPKVKNDAFTATIAPAYAERSVTVSTGANVEP